MVIDFFKEVNNRAFTWFNSCITPELKDKIIDISLGGFIEEQRANPTKVENYIFTNNKDTAYLLCHWLDSDKFSIAVITDLRNCQEAGLSELDEWTNKGRVLYMERTRKGAN